MEQRRPCIGIDLGTAYTRAASFDGNQMKVIPDQFGESAMPSCVAFTDSGVLIGRAARVQAPQNPTNTVFDVLRLIGRHYSDPSVQNDMRLWPFKVVAGPDDMLQVEVHWKGKFCQFTAVEICSMILTQIKENAQANIGDSIREAAVTVPVLFDYQQRQAIKEAGMIAGLNILQIVSSPAATALFYGMERSSRSTNLFNNIKRTVLGSEPEEYNMIIFDLGAGTLDVAVVTIRGHVCNVRATAGDVHLGGADFDNNLVDHYVNSLKHSGREDIRSFPMVISNLRTLCENAKISLSSGNLMVPMKITPLYSDVGLDSSITIAQFNVLNDYLFLKCIRIIETCLIDASISIDTVHEVILAGGSTRMPRIQNYLQCWFQGKNLTISQNLEAATSYGVAFQAFFLSRRENWRGHSLLLEDATPFSLGIKGPQGTLFVFVPKNTNIPFKREHRYRFTRSSFLVEVYEGNETMARANKLLGKFELSGAHIAQNWNNINIGFEMLEDGILKVVAEDILTGRRNGLDFTIRNIKDSKKRVREALRYEESEKSRIEASTTKSLTRSDTSKNWERSREKPTLDKLLSMNKERSEKIMGQSSRHYVEPDQYAIGIDFGTTHSRVAVWQRNGVKVIENEYGSRYTCSVVAFTDTGRLIGDTVHKEQVMTHPTNIVPNIKSLIGRCRSDQSVHDDTKLLPFRVISDDKNRYMVSVYYKNEEKVFAPEEIAATILSKMKEIAEAHLNSKVSKAVKAVISVPSSFNSSQRKAIKNAGAIAGLDVLQLLNETTAAAIAYFIQKVGGQNTSEKTLLIFDLGGGNLDVSIVKIKGGSICVQAVAGDTNLGGEDFDNSMVSNCVEKFKKEMNKDIRNKPRSLRRLRAACEKAKRVLSTNAQTTVEVDALDEGVDFRSVITRKEFEELNDNLFKKSISCVERCLEDAMMEKSIVDEVVLVGGSTRIPKMQQLLQDFFNGKELCKSINVDEAVVHGAAVQAAILSSNEDKMFNILELQDVTSSSFGLENKDGVAMNLLFLKHTPIPAQNEQIYFTCSDYLSSFLLKVQEFELASATVFSVSGITPKPRGSSRICLSFNVDSSGILNLRGKEVSGRVENEIVISEDSGGLTTQEIQKMAEAAARYKAEDEEQKARVAALLSLENLAYKVRALIRNLRGPASYKKSMEGVIEQALTWLDTNRNAGLDHIDDWKMHLETVKIALEESVRVDALNSLENLANRIKAIAKDPGVSTASKKSMEKAADDAIAFLEANYDAAIDEINARKAKLEIISSQIVYLGTSADS